MKTKNFNDAIIGNKEIISSYTKNGELLRLYYPNKDYRQFIDFFKVGVKLNDSNIIYLSDDINNIYNQKYIEDTNILLTEIKNTYFNLKVEQIDLIPINKNILLKRYIIKNENSINLDTKFIIHSKLNNDKDNNFVSGEITDFGMIQYSHDYDFCVFSKNVEVASHQINDSEKNINSANIYDKDYIGMSSDSSLSYDLGELKPGEKRILDIIISIRKSNEKENHDEVKKEIINLQKVDFEKEYQSTKTYWKKYLKIHSTIDMMEVSNEYEKKVDNIYKRSILLFPLLTNVNTGGIIAAVEVDEEREHCGRYSYCWPRDAVFIAKAMDILKMDKETERFYKSFCKNTQSENGMWEQRFYTDGRLAPCWGYQIDETASVIYGVYEHYLKIKDKKFLKDTLKMCEKANKYLKKYIEDILSGKREMHVSYDLWEMNEGIHLYSLSSIFAAFTAMLKIHEEVEELFVENRIKLEQIRKEKLVLEKYLVEIKKYILNNMYDDTRKVFLRNETDKNMDISILGAAVPFKVFSVKEKKMINTVESINLNLRTYTGGYKRFQEDHYMGGNPWVIATLWMALYYIELGEKKKAKECLEFVTKSSAENGLLPEQVNNETLEPAWVIGLGWSHAMYVIVLEKLMGLK
ncbi:MAG: hypothetical protein IKT41_03480 [Clostridia bacterium]|nr:hypothetical protein [Clostridia bacterium]